MAKTVTVLPATRRRHEVSTKPTDKRRVAGYARVSTSEEEQENSYNAQLDYWKKYIEGHNDWTFAGMYSDEGISGTSTKNRVGFNSMIEDALAGKIDLICTKSVSRFARNTVDSLTIIRKLKEFGTEVCFEKENIMTFDSKGEIIRAKTIRELRIETGLKKPKTRAFAVFGTFRGQQFCRIRPARKPAAG